MRRLAPGLLCLFLVGNARAGTAGGSPAPTRRAPTSAPRITAAPGDRISLDLKDADIRDVLRTFARLQHFNLVIDPDVKGSVTVRLVDVRWEQALDVILRSNGLSSEVERTIVRITTPDR